MPLDGEGRYEESLKLSEKEPTDSWMDGALAVIDSTKEMPKAWVPHGNGVWKQVLDLSPINYSMTIRWSTLLDGRTQVLKTDQSGG